ncbi:MAG TPA: tRNA uridine(34) 5-carboxymethylaminomethyl modification radical SAM/GNAT enzyme Elp3 [Nitrososphaera sp.]|nr:tRNA uridine(34) 5-carboxymethylaminomethyl modification radical SAM/GNAT enzyme Elp3 [Nitrososphaera sp.]
MLATTTSTGPVESRNDNSNTSNYDLACRAIAQELDEDNSSNSSSGITAGRAVAIMKKYSSEYRLDTLPKNKDVLKYLRSARSKRLLMVKPAKTASGVAVVAVMPEPYDCPHGRCIYCPGGVEYNTPLSYTGTEPSTRAAQKFNYDPFRQVQNKMDQLALRGHDTGKTELVIVGGTFPFMPAGYQRHFAKSCYDALNGSVSESLEEAISKNQVALNRCVGFTVETKPDYCRQEHIDLMLELGVTRVEIGVQSLQENVYKLVNRGHSLQDVVDAFRTARESGYKIVAHMMPGLPGSSPEKDIEDFRQLFQNEAFMPDMLKIYPTLVLEGTGLYKMHADGRYRAYDDGDLVNVVAEAKKMVPRWVRIMRVQREIESKDIVAGPRSGNFRQLVIQELARKGHKCNCIRCRETGLQKRYPDPSNVKLMRQDYMASGGREVFLSYEESGGETILGFLRLRKIGRMTHRKELEGSAVVRELHVYGQSVGIGMRDVVGESYQHRGYGSKLLQEAENIARSEMGVGKIVVISAVGTREYYRKQGYVQDGPYVSKVI